MLNCLQNYKTKWIISFHNVFFYRLLIKSNDYTER